MKKKCNGEKIILWLFLLAVVLAFVIMGFPQTPEVDAALNPSAEKMHAEEPAQMYDVPLDKELQSHINELCDHYDVDMPLALAIIGQESGYNPELAGDGGNSIGLMQIQPQWHAGRMDRLGVTDLADPYQNVTVGIDLLAELLDSGSVEWAITAYNAGTAKADFNREVGVTSEYTESVLILRGEIINAT